MSLLNDIVGYSAEMQASTRFPRTKIMNVLVSQEFQVMASSLQPAIGPSVLVVEDHALIALDLETMLLDLGASHVTIATTVNQALHLVETQPFNAAFLDVRLGEVTSLPVAMALRDKGIPFAITTGYDSASDIPAEFRTGPHIAKPYNAQDIANVWNILAGADRGS
jgi:CheY-like chemotaxis protein